MGVTSRTRGAQPVGVGQEAASQDLCWQLAGVAPPMGPGPRGSSGPTGPSPVETMDPPAWLPLITTPRPPEAATDPHTREDGSPPQQW